MYKALQQLSYNMKSWQIDLITAERLTLQIKETAPTATVKERVEITKRGLTQVLKKSQRCSC